MAKAKWCIDHSSSKAEHDLDQHISTSTKVDINLLLRCSPKLSCGEHIEYSSLSPCGSSQPQKRGKWKKEKYINDYNKT